MEIAAGCRLRSGPVRHAWWLLAVSISLCTCRREPPAGAPQRPFGVAVYYDLTTLDPHVEATISSSVLYNVYEALVDVDANLEVRPGLAESWTTPEDLTWIFRLRPTARFHSGKLLRAADVVYSIERVLRDPDLESGYYLVDVSSVRALNEHTVEIRTAHPASNLPNRLSIMPIVPEGSSRDSLATSADGTGPYQVVEWKKSQSLRLTRHVPYWGRLAPLRDVVFSFNRDPAEIERGLLAGEYQLATLGGGDAGSRLLASAAHQVLRADSLHVKYLAYDLARDTTPFCGVRPNPFKDKRVREAIDLALDRRRLAAALPGEAAPATQVVPRFVFGFDPEILLSGYDPVRAKALLREAGLGSGFAVTLHSRAVLAPAAALIREQLAAVGVAVEVRALGDLEHRLALDRGDMSFWLSRWGCATGDAGELLENAMHSLHRPQRLGLYNRTGYNSPALDRAIEDSRDLVSRIERRSALQALMRSITADRLWLPLYTDQEAYVLDRSFSWRPRYTASIRVAEVSVLKPAPRAAAAP